MDIREKTFVDYKRRLDLLKSLKNKIKEHQGLIYEALYQDLGKSKKESYLTEVGFVLEEINLFLKKLKNWTRPQRVPTPWLLKPATSHIYSEPYGRVLIFSTWNYPFQLSLSPLIGAIAAGNTVVLKPSEKATYTEKVLQKIISDVFLLNEVEVVLGGEEASKKLLKQKWDFIFFTGSSRIGKIILKEAVEHLTPVCLELGGKSPCVVESDAHLEVAVRRIAWGKFLNAGQTCVAPDYLLVHEDIYDDFIKSLQQTISMFYKNLKQFGKIIDQNHFLRLESFLKDSEIIFGGAIDRENLRISPTLIKGDLLSSIMQEEIFGPILPIFKFKKKEVALDIIKKFEHPLASYFFTSSKVLQKFYIKNLSFGGGCVNDTVLHLANLNLPFGGVSQSGVGRYHGKASFDLFTYKKSILIKSNFLDPKLRYPPYSES